MTDPTRILYIVAQHESTGARKSLLESFGEFDVRVATTARQVEALLAEGSVDCVLCSIHIDEDELWDTLSHRNDNAPTCPLVMFDPKPLPDEPTAVEPATYLSHHCIASQILRVTGYNSTNASEDEKEVIEPAAEELIPDTPPPNSEATAHQCPVPGCDVSMSSIEQLAKHCRERAEGAGLDARLHDRLDPTANATPRSPDREFSDQSSPEKEVEREMLQVDPNDLDTMSEMELYALARSAGIKGRSGMKRAELIRSLRDRVEAPDLEETPPESVPGKTDYQIEDPQPIVQTEQSPVEQLATSVIEEDSDSVRQEKADDQVFSFSPKERLPSESLPKEDPDPPAEAPDVERIPGTSTLVCSTTRSAERRETCDSMLTPEGSTNPSILLIRYRKIDPERLEALAVSAKQLTLVSVGYSQTIPDSLRDMVDTVEIDKPGELRRLGIVLTKIIEEWSDSAEDIYLCLDSLDVILQYAETQGVFRFLHIFTGKLDDVDAVSHFHVDPSSVEETDINILGTLFDDVMQVGDRS